MILSKDLLFKSIQQGWGSENLAIWMAKVLEYYCLGLRSMGFSSLWQNCINSVTFLCYDLLSYVH